MERKDFLKNGLGFLGMALIAPSMLSSNENGERTGEDTACQVTNSETAGPFPTITPASLVIANIVGDRTGVAFTVNIIIKNINNSCNALEGAIVDIWHCDKDGNYSEYGGTQMQPTNYTNAHFLRGRQTSDASGKVSFTSVFPGWYTGRATHIHVHVYNTSGASLLITQIAFPEGAGSAVATVNAATSYGYTKGLTGYTYNASDNVFSDGTTNEMSAVTGSLSAGYVLDHEIFVSGPTGTVATGIATANAESQFQVGQNYPNPFAGETVIPVILRQPSTVKIDVMNLSGQKVKTITTEGLGSGAQNITLDLSGLASGRYIYSIETTNANGTFKQSKIMLKQ